jgi:hypothetical protein
MITNAGTKLRCAESKWTFSIQRIYLFFTGKSIMSLHATPALLFMALVFAVEPIKAAARPASDLTVPDTSIEDVQKKNNDAGASVKITPDMETKIRRFLDRFVDAGKTPQEQLAFFADDVQYYDQGMIGKPAILRDVHRYVRHWPQRNYRVAKIDYINPDPDSDSVFVSYTIDFMVANRTRTIAGKARYGALISSLGNSPKIAAIQEKVTERKTHQALR